MMGFSREDLTEEQLAEQAAVYGPLADSIRRLVDASIRTTVDAATVESATQRLNALADQLDGSRIDGGFGVRYTEGGRSRAWGNAVIGLRNPIAPPLVVHREEGRVHAEVTLGAPYEGPPGLVHGGVSALLLDQLLGEACSAGKRPGMTGTLALRYRRGVKLGRLRCEAEISGFDGPKTFASGRISTDDGVCVEAEGTFILPRWAREFAPKPDRFE
ncbi:MAG: PaaI family thioesterase [Nocardioides sp.]|jgi:acyl-coenzyme A thioesterase PaaI-like protein